jgi:class 3 adenylate cyclase
MGMSNPIQFALNQKQRELQLVLALDGVRDSFEDDEDPMKMFTAIADLLKTWFQAQACGIMILNEEGNDIEAVGSTGMFYDVAVELCRRATQFDEWSVLTDWRWKNVIGMRINLKNRLLGGVVLARDTPSFDQAELGLLKAAESQIDSSVMQARTIWKFIQRNHQLEAIYEIDRLRDFTASENDLISGFTAILLERFNAELCMIILSHVDSGEMIVRGVVDKHDFPAAVLEAVQHSCGALEKAQIIPTPAGMTDFNLLASPLVVAGARLGAVVVGRKTRFAASERQLLTAMTTQMDSAIAYSRVSQQLQNRNRELETIYRLDRIRDEEQDFDAMLQQALLELCKIVISEAGYIMLYDDQGRQLELRSATVEGLLTTPGYYEVIQQFSRKALEIGNLVFENKLDGAVRSIIAVPLILNDRIIGVFGAVNSGNSRGFSADDRRILSAITSQVDTAIFERMEQRRMRNVLSRSVDPKVLEYLLARADTHLLSGERVVVTVMFADLRGSTEWAERIAPEQLVEVLNNFLGRMTEIIFKHGGTLDKFVGDEVIGLFGSPLFMEDHAARAAHAALEMQAAQDVLRGEWAAKGRELPPMGVGLSSGEVIAGEFGPPIRTAFTAMGRIVNLGSRLCGAAEAGQVLISQATYDLIQPNCVANRLEPRILKGIRNPLPVYELVSMKD